VLGFGWLAPRRRQALSLALSLACLPATWACSSSSEGPTDAADEHSLTGSNPDGGAGEAGDGGALTLTTTLRLAQLSRDLGVVDVCYRSPSSQTFSGPIFASAMIPVDSGAGSDGAARDGATDAADTGQVVASDAGQDATVTDATRSDSSASDATLSDAATDAEGDTSVRDAAPSDALEEAPARDASSPDAGDASTPDASPEAGSSSGLAYLQVSSYVTIQGAGTFEIIVVPGGQGSCTSPILDRKVTLDDGKRATLATFGSAGAEAGAYDALDLVAMVDDPSIAMGGTRTRFFDSARNAPDAGAVPSPPELLVSVVGSPTLELALVVPGAAPMPNATPPTADALGYHTDVPVAAPAQLRIQADADGGLDASAPLWVSTPVDLHLDPASLHTGFLVRSALGEFAVLWCDDTSFGSASSACTLLLR
jgi:hypothetical protein